VRVCRLCTSATATDDSQHAVTLANLRALRAAQPGASTNTWKWRFVFSGGQPPAAAGLADGGGAEAGFAGDLLYTGHRDGRVRVWDASSEVPVVLTTVPFDAGGQTGRLRGVTALDVCTASGLLAVAHDKGDVRVYQFGRDRREVSQAVLSVPGGRPSFQTAAQPAGYQCVAHVTAHEADVSALALASRCPLLAAGDVNGNVSVVDLAQPAVLHRLAVCPSPLVALGIGAYVVPPPPPAKRAKDAPSSPAEAAPDIRCAASGTTSASQRAYGPCGGTVSIADGSCEATAVGWTCLAGAALLTVAWSCWQVSVAAQMRALQLPWLSDVHCVPVQAGAVHGEQGGQRGAA